MSLSWSRSVPPRDPLVPVRGRTIADLLPAVLDRVGHGDGSAADLGLPMAERWVIVLVDGLGRVLLDEHADLAPTLTSVEDAMAGRGGLTSCVPSTTATSLTSLGTGTWPAAHGIAGFAFWLPEVADVFHPLAWRPERPVRSVAPVMPLLERAGLGAQVSLERFAGSGLTLASLGAGEFVPCREGHRTTQIEAVAATSARTRVVYTYERELDHAGHEFGCRTPQWRDMLTTVDRFVADLRAALPDDTRIIVTGDHGMVDVPGRNRVIVSEEPQLAQGVSHVIGEPRFTHLRTAEPDGVAARWAAWFGDHAWVRTRDAAIADGWFGPADAVAAGPLIDRLGDVLVAMRDDWGVLARPGTAMGEIVGHHGSLTPAEMRIPLVVL